MQPQPYTMLHATGATHRTFPNTIMKHHGNLRSAQPSRRQFENAPVREARVEATGTRKAHDMEAQIKKSKNISSSSAEAGG